MFNLFVRLNVEGVKTHLLSLSIGRCCCCRLQCFHPLRKGLICPKQRKGRFHFPIKGYEKCLQDYSAIIFLVKSGSMPMPLLCCVMLWLSFYLVYESFTYDSTRKQQRMSNDDGFILFGPHDSFCGEGAQEFV